MESDGEHDDTTEVAGRRGGYAVEDAASKRISLPLSSLQACFGLNLVDAAKRLGVCRTTLKRICRRVLPFIRLFASRLQPAACARLLTRRSSVVLTRREHGIARWPRREMSRVSARRPLQQPHMSQHAPDGGRGGEQAAAPEPAGAVGGRRGERSRRMPSSRAVPASHPHRPSAGDGRGCDAPTLPTPPCGPHAGLQVAPSSAGDASARASPRHSADLPRGAWAGGESAPLSRRSSSLVVFL